MDWNMYFYCIFILGINNAYIYFILILHSCQLVSLFCSCYLCDFFFCFELLIKIEKSDLAVHCYDNKSQAEFLRYRIHCQPRLAIVHITVRYIPCAVKHIAWIR